MTEFDKPLFENPALDISQLPSIKDIQFIPLSPAYRRYALLTNLLTFIILMLPLSGVWINAERWVAILASVIWGILFLCSVILVRYQYQVKGYVVRTYDVVYRRGLFFRRVTTIPFSRTQHCEIQEGPLERMFGLNTLLVYTAGGSSSDLAIPGLAPDEAQRLRNFILQKVSGKDEEE